MSEKRKTKEGQISSLKEEIAALKEENSRLRKSNYSINEKIKKMESGNFDEFFVYSTPELELPPKGSGSVTISLSRDSDFYLTKMVRTGRGFKFRIEDSGNDRKWSNLPLDARAGAGTAGLPLILPKPKFLARATVVTVEFQNTLDCLNPVSLSLVGYKVFYVTDLTELLQSRE